MLPKGLGMGWEVLGSWCAAPQRVRVGCGARRGRRQPDPLVGRRVWAWQGGAVGTTSEWGPEALWGCHPLPLPGVPPLRSVWGRSEPHRAFSIDPSLQVLHRNFCTKSGLREKQFLTVQPQFWGSLPSAVRSAGFICVCHWKIPL